MGPRLLNGSRTRVGPMRGAVRSGDALHFEKVHPHDQAAADDEAPLTRVGELTRTIVLLRPWSFRPIRSLVSGSSMTRSDRGPANVLSPSQPCHQRSNHRRARPIAGAGAESDGPPLD